MSHHAFLRALKLTVGLALSFSASKGAFAQASCVSGGPPCVSSITPTSFTQGTITANVTGTNFANGQTLASNPLGKVTGTSFVVPAGSTTTATATFTLAKDAAGTINIGVVTPPPGGKITVPPDPSLTAAYYTGIQCLESVGSTCALRFEIEASSASTSSSNTATNTTPNILVKLDYQFVSPKKTTANNFRRSDKTKGPRPAGNPSRLDIHGVLKVGYSQVTTTTNLTPTTTSAAPAPAMTCPAPATAAGQTPCTTAAAPQQAFIADAAAHVGWKTKQDTQGVFATVGGSFRAAFQDIIATNQITKINDVSYVDLSALNPRNVVGLYEGVARLSVSQFHGAATVPSGDDTVYDSSENVSNFLVVEGGYQNNSGLTHLVATSPQMDTRNRFVGRLSLYPEIPGTSHTKGLVGFEYSAGFGGGPKIVQLFFGLNANALKSLFAGTTNNSGGN